METIIAREDIAKAEADLRAAIKRTMAEFEANPLSQATDLAIANMERSTSIFRLTLKIFNAQQQYNNTKTN